MRPSAKAEYACLAMLELARRGRDAPPARLRDLAGPTGIPEAYLVQILLQLKASGLVHSTRGASGGYRLARPAADITVADVLAVLEGPPPPTPEPDHPLQRALASLWRDAQAAQDHVLGETTLDDILAAATPAPEWVI
jgi:Rrf2 family protein